MDWINDWRMVMIDFSNHILQALKLDMLTGDGLDLGKSAVVTI
jgi:hypothetical protein